MDQDIWVAVEIEDATALDNRMAINLLPSKTGVPLATFAFKDDLPNVWRRSWQLQGVGGTISLPSDAGQDEFANIWGIGARYVYGGAEQWSFEGALSLVFTERAEFTDSSTAEATMLRGSLGVLYHFRGNLIGEDELERKIWIPYARVALGARVSRYKPTPGDNSELLGGGLVLLGLGVDAWAVGNFVLGASAFPVLGFGGNDESFSFEAEAYIGFAWKP